MRHADGLNFDTGGPGSRHDTRGPGLDLASLTAEEASFLTKKRSEAIRARSQARFELETSRKIYLLTEKITTWLCWGIW